MSVSRITIVLSCCALALIYCVQFIAARFSLAGDISPLGLSVIRFIVAGLMFLPYAASAGGLAKARQLGLGRIATLSVLAGFPYQLVINSGIAVTSAGYVTAVGAGCIILFSFLLSWFLLGARPDRAAWASTAAICVGLFLFIYNAFLVDGISIIGTVLFVLQGLMFAAYGTLIKRWAVDSVLATAVISLASCIPAIFALVFQELDLASASLAELLVQAIVQGALAGAASILLYNYIMLHIGPQRGSLVIASVPVITTILGYLLLDEIPSALQIFGVMAMIVGIAAPGVFLITRARPPRISNT